MEQPDLFSYGTSDEYHHRIPAPSVEDSPTSAGRAKREDDSGITSKRQKQVLDVLLELGVTGGTWKDIGDRLGLHHGQASGALSPLHGAGLIFALTTPRNNCQPYVHANFRQNYLTSARHDSPVTTKAGRKRASLQALHEAVTVWLAHPTDANLEIMRKANKDVEE